MKIGYVRVSTTEQAETDALEQQTARVKRAGAALIFSDVESGKSDKRSQFNKMLDLCKKGGVTEIICTRIDRLGRSIITIHKTLTFFEKQKIKLSILDAPIDDINSPFGWFSVSQMAQLAEFESRLLSSRIKHGLAYFREQKKAAPRPPFGYMRVDEKYAPDTSRHECGLTRWDIGLDIIDRFLLPNSTFRSTARYALTQYQINWTMPGLRYWMNSPVLRGHTAYNMRGNLNYPERWEVYENTHQPMITPDTYRLIQERIAENRTRYPYGNNKTRYDKFPLEGQILCGCCGYKLYIKKSGKYLTQRVRCKKHDSSGDDFCKNKVSSHLPTIIEAVDLALMGRINEIASYTHSTLPEQKESPEIEAQYQQLRSLKLLPKSPIIKDAINQTIEEIARLKQVSVVSNLVNNDLLELLKTTIGNPKYWKGLPDKDKYLIYKELVDTVTVANGEILDISLRV